MKLGTSVAPPPDPTNEYGDVTAAAELGKGSSRTSSSRRRGPCRVRLPRSRKGFTDAVGEPTGLAEVTTGNRNSPSVALAAHSRWQFWDGRADTLWMQALGHFETTRSSRGNRLFVAQQIADRYDRSADDFSSRAPRRGS